MSRELLNYNYLCNINDLLARMEWNWGRTFSTQSGAVERTAG
jgi:hypothetical protein